MIQNAGITPESDAEGPAGTDMQRQNPARPAPPVGEVNLERLSVFEDFVGKLDLSKLDKDKPDSDEKDDDEGSQANRPDKAKKPKKK